MNDFPEPIIREEIGWPSSNFGPNSRSNVQIYKNSKEKYVIVAIERDDNPGQSITNGAENLWKFVLHKYKLKSEDCTFIESYHYKNSPNSYSFVFITEETSTEHNGEYDRELVKWAPLDDFQEFIRNFFLVELPSSRLDSID